MVLPDPSLDRYHLRHDFITPISLLRSFHLWTFESILQLKVMHNQTFDLTLRRHALQSWRHKSEAPRSQPSGHFGEHSDVLLFVPLVEVLQVLFSEHDGDRHLHGRRPEIARFLP